MHGEDRPAEKRKVEGIDMLLPFLVVGTWIAFVVFGLAQEGVTRTKFGEGDAAEQFKFTTFLVLLQSVGNALVVIAKIRLTSIVLLAPASIRTRCIISCLEQRLCF